jgi:amino acid transporter
MSPAAANYEAMPARLGVWDAVSIIVGIIIGASIFRSPGEIYGNIPDTDIFRSPIPAWLVGLGLFALVGLISLVGALCYAELATTYTSSGGDYTFIKRAYGDAPAFLFAWSDLAVIRAGGNVSAMAYVFGDYAQRIMPLPGLGSHASFAYAVGAVVVVGTINALGVRSGKWTQNALTILKLIGIAAIIVAAAVSFSATRAPDQLELLRPKVVQYPPSLAIAAVFVFYAYGGWGDAAYVVAELRDRRRNILRSLVLGVMIVTLIYIALNAAYLLALGVQHLRRSPLPAADVMALPLGETGVWLISVLIMISALGGINGMTFAGMRLYSTFGRDERLFARLSGKDAGTPFGSIAAMILFSVGMMTLFETGEWWKPWLVHDLDLFGIELPENFTKKAGGFSDVVSATAPVYWLFFLLSGFSLLVLRGRNRRAERPFRVPLYPLTPLLFCAASAFMLYQSTTYALTLGPAELAIVAGFVLLGIPLYALSGPSEEKIP